MNTNFREVNLANMLSLFAKPKVAPDFQPQICKEKPNKIRLKPIKTFNRFYTRPKTKLVFSSTPEACDLIQRVNDAPALLELKQDKTLPITVVSAANDIKKFDISLLSGKYAYIILTLNLKQYLAIKRLDNYQSNHGILPKFAKLGKFGSYIKKAKVLCGGEIIFHKGQIEYWNLKSGSFSRKTMFDEITSFNFEENVKGLWLPRNLFRYIHESERTYNPKYSPKGSLRRHAEHQETISSDKTENSDDSYPEEFVSISANLSIS